MCNESGAGVKQQSTFVDFRSIFIYRAVIGATPGAKGEVLFRHAFVDAWSAAEQRDGATILADANRYVTRNARIGYCFLGAELAGGLVTARVDREASGSDHQPLWVEIRM